MLILAGRLDQPRLDELRAALGLTPSGRLTDREDARFGFRELGDDGNPSLVLKLWRVEDDQWAISVDVAAGSEVGEDDIVRWRDETEAAATMSGLQTVECRSFPAERRTSYLTDWRNEDWLRTTKWDLPAQSLPELWSVIGVRASASSAEKRAELMRFMATPAWEAAPGRIKQEAEDFLR
ncbi:hypothetical protein [Nocardia sp. CDC160]|uniref:hypothetical protein n=1 Tax=Nocardia sp. CDC160 TaxID=3112166 RepID=UPI002DBF0769|nr:hypothetical protein [Nocardia sp. CDC160]MEC3919228.1 hypothetical protein [Nocardia sp. CDC160]